MKIVINGQTLTDKQAATVITALGRFNHFVVYDKLASLDQLGSDLHAMYLHEIREVMRLVHQVSR